MCYAFYCGVCSTVSKLSLAVHDRKWNIGDSSKRMWRTEKFILAIAWSDLKLLSIFPSCQLGILIASKLISVPVSCQVSVPVSYEVYTSMLNHPFISFPRLFHIRIAPKTCLSHALYFVVRSTSGEYCQRLLEQKLLALVRGGVQYRDRCDGLKNGAGWEGIEQEIYRKVSDRASSGKKVRGTDWVRMYELWIHLRSGRRKTLAYGFLYCPFTLGGRSAAERTVTISSNRCSSYQVFT